MIESQSELPVQDRQPLALRERGEQVLRALLTHLQVAVSHGRRGAEYLREAGSWARGRTEEISLSDSLNRVAHWVIAGVRDGSLLNRYALHIVVVFLALSVVTVAQATIPEIDVSLPAPTAAPELGVHTVSEPTSNRGVNRLVQNSNSLLPNPVAHTVLAERDRMQVITYTVQRNDNIWSIAQGFGLKAETVLWANSSVERSPDLLSVGQKLVIPPVDGIWYTVQKNDTVEKLAKTYETSVEKIVSFELNNLQEPYELAVGQQIMLPDGRKKVVPSNYYPMTRVGRAPSGAPKGSGRFAWPTQGILTQRYWSGHLGIDIGNRTGTPIRAADAGYVVLAGVDTWGYGNQVLIDHGNGYLTRYAHLHTIKVRAGDSVSKNQVIGTMGSTGRSTGPHLHFEVIYNNTRRNPLGFLPGS
jgi:murein DD-endopeptidase MepM/ murein hydrolase activator NlpD